jgi:hypothetical protein
MNPVIDPQRIPAARQLKKEAHRRLFDFLPVHTFLLSPAEAVADEAGTAGIGFGAGERPSFPV